MDDETRPTMPMTSGATASAAVARNRSSLARLLAVRGTLDVIARVSTVGRETGHGDEGTNARSNGVPFATDVSKDSTPSAFRWSVGKRLIHFSTSRRAAQYVSSVLPED